MELIKGIRDNFRDNYFGKFNSSVQEKLDKFVNGQNLFLFQPTELVKIRIFWFWNARRQSQQREG